MARLRAARFGVAVAVIAALGVAAAMWRADAAGPAREIRLVARGMAFYLESDPATPNPTLVVKTGERVRIVLTNQERGFTHDVAVPAMQAGIDGLDWNEAGSMVLGVPLAPGDYEYVCRPHAAMMRGTLRVTE